MPPFILTPAAHDSQRLDLAVCVPDFFVALFALGCLITLLIGRWSGALGFAGPAAVLLLLSWRMRRRSILAILLATLVTGWMVIPLWLCGRAIFAASRLRRQFGLPPRHTAANRLHLPRSLPEALQLIAPAFLFLLCAVAALAAFFLSRIGLPFAVFHWLTRVANRQERRIRRILSCRAQEMRARDPRPIVLFLHSFADDDLPLVRRLEIHVRVLKASLTLEELVVSRLWRVGPVVAIGKPKELFSPLGAAREYITGDAWQPEVTALLQQSVVVVSILGGTQGVLWEYRRVLEAGKPLVVVVPNAPPAVSLSRWRAFCAVFPPAAQISVPADGRGDFPLLVWFPPAGDPLVLLASERDEVSYDLAFEYLLPRITLSAPHTISTAASAVAP